MSANVAAPNGVRGFVYFMSLVFIAAAALVSLLVFCYYDFHFHNAFLRCLDGKREIRWSISVDIEVVHLHLTSLRHLDGNRGTHWGISVDIEVVHPFSRFLNASIIFIYIML
jgi:hypothetical protein